MSVSNAFLGSNNYFDIYCSEFITRIPFGQSGATGAAGGILGPTGDKGPTGSGGMLGPTGPPSANPGAPIYSDSFMLEFIGPFNGVPLFYQCSATRVNNTITLNLPNIAFQSTNGGPPIVIIGLPAQYYPSTNKRQPIIIINGNEYFIGLFRVDMPSQTVTVSGTLAGGSFRKGICGFYGCSMTYGAN